MWKTGLINDNILICFGFKLLINLITNPVIFLIWCLQIQRLPSVILLPRNIYFDSPIPFQLCRIRRQHQCNFLVHETEMLLKYAQNLKLYAKYRCTPCLHTRSLDSFSSSHYMTIDNLNVPHITHYFLSHTMFNYTWYGSTKYRYLGAIMTQEHTHHLVRFPYNTVIFLRGEVWFLWVASYTC